MGFFWEGLPPYLLNWASDLLGQTTLAIETGTFRGDTSLLLAQHFGECLTIERSDHLARRAQERFAGDSRVTVHHGSSRDLLPTLLPDPSRPCFFWLDAHGIYDFSGPNAEENPLLQELSTIINSRLTGETIVAIDDARGMGTQPDWPSLGEITTVLNSAGFVSVVFDDIVVATKTTGMPDFYDLYQQSRMVEAKSLFQVWNKVMRTVRLRQRTDELLGFVTRKS